jgi:ABC-type glycerol-3-phosphate transport system permease component
MAALTTALPQQAAGTARRRMRRRKAAGWSGFYVMVTAFVLVSLFPFYWIVITALKTQPEINAGTSGLWPAHFTWSSFSTMLHQGTFARALLNSVIVAGSTTILTVIIASLAGYGLARTTIRGKSLIMGFLLVAGFFPVIAMVGPIFITYRSIHLLDNLVGLIFVYFIYSMPLATWFLTSYFGQIPRELEEAAIVDGATRLQALRRVIIPVAVPGIFTVAIIGFIFCWNDFLLALSFLSSPSNYTAPLAITNLGQSQYQTFYNLIDAMVVIITLPIALIVLFAQRRIISGLTAGSFR